MFIGGRIDRFNAVRKSQFVVIVRNDIVVIVAAVAATAIVLAIFANLRITRFEHFSNIFLFGSDEQRYLCAN